MKSFFTFYIIKPIFVFTLIFLSPLISSCLKIRKLNRYEYEYPRSYPFNRIVKEDFLFSKQTSPYFTKFQFEEAKICEEGEKRVVKVYEITERKLDYLSLLGNTLLGFFWGGLSYISFKSWKDKKEDLAGLKVGNSFFLGGGIVAGAISLPFLGYTLASPFLAIDRKKVFDERISEVVFRTFECERKKIDNIKVELSFGGVKKSFYTNDGIVEIRKKDIIDFPTLRGKMSFFYKKEYSYELDLEHMAIEELKLSVKNYPRKVKPYKENFIEIEIRNVGGRKSGIISISLLRQDKNSYKFEYEAPPIPPLSTNEYYKTNLKFWIVRGLGETDEKKIVLKAVAYDEHSISNQEIFEILIDE